MQEEYWSLEIENFLVRILPGNTDDPEYKKRTSKFYKITGLPLNTTARDIGPIVEHLFGRTCTFTQTSKYSTMKNAYVYVDPKNYPDVITNAVSTPFNNSPIYIYPHTLIPKTCNICGTYTHTTDNCDDKNFTLNRNNRKIFNKRLIQRNSEKISINKDHKTKFSHVITLNASRACSNEAQANKHPQRQEPKNHQSPQISIYSTRLKRSMNRSNTIRYTYHYQIIIVKRKILKR